VVTENNPEVEHHSENSDVAAHLQHTLEAPIQLHQVLAITESDVEGCETFEYCACCRKNATKGEDEELMDAEMSDSRFGFGNFLWGHPSQDH
jgi:hypothetical protein